jgi:hypothetical protein
LGSGSAAASTLITGSTASSALISDTVSGVASVFCTVPPAVASSGIFSVGVGRALSLVEVGRRAFPMS